MLPAWKIKRASSPPAILGESKKTKHIGNFAGKILEKQIRMRVARAVFIVINTINNCGMTHMCNNKIVQCTQG